MKQIATVCVALLLVACEGAGTIAVDKGLPIGGGGASAPTTRPWRDYCATPGIAPSMSAKDTSAVTNRRAPSR